MGTRFLTPLSLPQALLVLDACESGRRRVGLKTVSQALRTLTREDFAWLEDMFDFKIPAHTSVCLQTEGPGPRCPRCKYNKLSYEERRATLTPLRVAKVIDDYLRTNFEAKLVDPALRKRTKKA